jgi:hypothetical protein
MMTQLLVLQARIAYRQTCILSGFYKSREVRINNNGPILTEDELLKNEIMTIERHIKLMQDIQDNLAPSDTEN